MRKWNRDIGDWERFVDSAGFIRLILLVDWDPIGVFGYAGAMNEYDSYVPDIYNLLASGASQEDIIAHLRRIEVESMGMRDRSETSLSMVAAKLRAVYDTAYADQKR